MFPCFSRVPPGPRPALLLRPSLDPKFSTPVRACTGTRPRRSRRPFLFRSPPTSPPARSSPAPRPPRSPACLAPSSHTPPGVTMGTRGRGLCLIPTAVQGGGKIKQPKATRRQFNSSLYYCNVKEVYIQGIFPAKHSSSQGPPPPGSAIRSAAQRAPHLGSPSSFAPPAPPPLSHPNPVSWES